MLTIEVEFLTGTYTASQFNDRDRFEWPPHPARVFSAMVAAWADSDNPDPAEADALRWLESQDNPTITCSMPADSSSQTVERLPVTHYVPVNDAKSALELLPVHRATHPRTYPTVRPDDPVVAFAWPEASAGPETILTLNSLLSRVGRLGHSSSLVSCRAINLETGQPNLVPSPLGNLKIRLPGVGQMDSLIAMFQSHLGRQPRVLPARMVSYATPAEAANPIARSNLTGQFIVANLAGPAVSLRGSLAVARAVRAALLNVAGQDRTIPEALSGHLPRARDEGLSTDPTRKPHLAVVPLPFVGHRYADGLLKGIAFVLPTELSHTDEAAIFKTLGRWLIPQSQGEGAPPNLWGEGLDGKWSAIATGEGTPIVTLRRSRWAAPAVQWATATPIVLDRYPDGLWRGAPARQRRAEAQAIDSIVSSCTMIGLPEPVRVEIRPDAPIRGALPVRQHPPFRSGSSQAIRPQVHAIIEFSQRVAGPLLLGRGRFLGQGLCLPLRSNERGIAQK